MKWPLAKLKFVTRFGYGDTLPRDEGQTGPFQVFGSNGPYATFTRSNTDAPAIVVGRKGSYGKINWTSEPCFASDTTFFVDSSTTRHHLRWIYWLLLTLHLDEGTDEAAVPGLNRETAYSKDVPVPPLTHQQAIADYLDRETGRLDILITAKQRLLALLAEKRRALITRAVTHGLDYDVQFCYSGGTPWLGEIPAHWSATRLKFVAQVRGGLALGKRYGARSLVELPYLRVANVQDGHLDLLDVATVRVTPDEAATCLLQTGDVLMNEGGDADKLGRGAIWQGEIAPCLHQNHVFAVRPNTQKVHSVWLNAWTSSEGAKAYLESRAKQSTNLASISSTNIKEMPIALPPLDEQKAVVEALDGMCRQIDKLKMATEKTIELLKERRAALIAAAVYGQVEIPTQA
jgi:type I restriction enzyme S subunit